MHVLTTREQNDTSSTELYAELNIGKEATTAEIRKAYHRLALTAHPDKGGDPARFDRISHAYETLSNAKLRARYDLSGKSGPLTVEQEFRANFFAASGSQDAEFAGMTVMEERRARERKRLANVPNDGLTNAEREIASVMAEESARLKSEQLADVRPLVGAAQSPLAKSVSMPVPTAAAGRSRGPGPLAAPVIPPEVRPAPVISAPPIGEKTPKPTLAAFLGQARPDWVAKDLQNVLEKLAKIEVVDVAGLLAALRAKGEADLNTRLRQAGKKGFAEATMQALLNFASAT